MLGTDGPSAKFTLLRLFFLENSVFSSLAALSQDKQYRQKSCSKKTVLIVCQMALFFVASSLNRRGGFTPGFIPVHLTGMSDSSMPCGASPISVFSFLFLVSKPSV